MAGETGKISVAIIGAGEIGTTIAKAIDARASVLLWDADRSKIPAPMKPIEQSVGDATVVFLCVPSRALRQAASSVRPHLRRDAVVVALSKGLEERTRKTTDQVLAETLAKKQPVALLGGPLLAEELRKDLPGVGVLATRNRRSFAAVAALFAGSAVRLEWSRDPHGVAVASVLKNVYAVALGIAEGLGWGWNAKGWLAAASLAEMRGIAPRFAARAAAIDGSAGAGDFFATAMSSSSKNRRSGQEIAKTGRCESPGEGCRSLPAVLKRIGAKAVKRFPILIALDRVVNGHAAADAVFDGLLASPPSDRKAVR